MTARTHQKRFFCSICDASCGLIAMVHEAKVVNVIPDKHHPVSKGYCCPKGLALHHVTNDPDRVRTPLKHVDGTWQPISWKQAIHEIASKLAEIRDRHGPDAIASHMGTNGGHCFSHSMYWKGFCDAIGTNNRYTAGSVDDNNKFVAQYFLYGNSTIMPIPDLIHADFLLLIGTNPAVTNLSLAKCSNVMEKVTRIARRGKVVIIDPRRTETVKALASDPACHVQHHFIAPGTDAWLLLAMLNIVISERLLDEAFIRKHVEGLDRVKPLLSGFTLELAEQRTGINAEIITSITREFARTKKAVIYARLGTCVGPFPTINAWAIEALHAITGHLDKEGCAIFGHGPFSVAKVGRLIKLGEFNQWRSRIGKFPSVMGALPLGILAREITTPGAGRVRALVESGGNIALTAPNSVEIQEAFKQLDILVSIDFYRNETTTIAAEFARVPLVYLLPATTPLERENIHVTHLNYNIVPHVEYHDSVIQPARAGPRPEWEIYMALTRKMQIVPFGNKLFRLIARFLNLVHKELNPGIIVGLLAIIGNLMEHHPPMLSRQALTLGEIRRRKVIVWKEHRHGTLPACVLTRDKKVHLYAPEIHDMLQDVAAESIRDRDLIPDTNSFTLIGRRQLKTMNSWLHNIHALHAHHAPPRMLMHEDDASIAGLRDGDMVLVMSQTGELVVPIEITRDIVRRCVSYPHGWGHRNAGLSFATIQPGENYNKVVASTGLEPISGMPRFNAIRVRIKKTG